MKVLPEGTLLGELAIVETYVDYDGPRVFLCQSKTDQQYLVGWAEEGDTSDTWLFLPVSKRRLQMVRSGGIPLREAFVDAEGFVYRVETPFDGERTPIVEPMAGGRLESDWLPEESFRLMLRTETLPSAPSDEEFRRRATQESRSLARIEVDLPRYSRTEAPTRRIGELLLSMQSLYDNVGLALIEPDPPQFGRFPSYVARQTATDIVGLSAASFVIEIASNQLDDLLGDSVFGDITARVTQLLDIRVEREQLLEELASLRARGARSFRNFVKRLVDIGGTVTFAGASSAHGYMSQTLTSENLDTLYRILSRVVPDDVHEIRGPLRLYAADMESRQFGALDPLSDDHYEGRISSGAMYQVDHLPLNGDYEMVITESRTVDEGTGERKPVYVLDQLTELTPEAEARGVTRTPVVDLDQ